MGMDNVEFPRPLGETLQHHGIGKHRVEVALIEPEGLRPAGFKLGARLRIPGCKQGDVVPQSHQLFRQPKDYTFSTTVQLGRDGLGQWRDLCDAH
jgi:hypothetical protein